MKCRQHTTRRRTNLPIVGFDPDRRKISGDGGEVLYVQPGIGSEDIGEQEQADQSQQPAERSGAFVALGIELACFGEGVLDKFCTNPHYVGSLCAVTY